MKHPRCIAIHRVSGRCRRRAAVRRYGQIYLCGQHALGVMVEADLGLSLRARRLLAFARWRTEAEARALVAGMRRPR